MNQGRLARQVEQTSLAILAAEQQIRVLEEQVQVWSEMRDDLHTRSLVSETPQAQQEYNAMERQLALAVEALSDQRTDRSSLEAVLSRLMSEWEPEVLL